jgi:hypothetical protein
MTRCVRTRCRFVMPSIPRRAWTRRADLVRREDVPSGVPKKQLFPLLPMAHGGGPPRRTQVSQAHLGLYETAPAARTRVILAFGHSVANTDSGSRVASVVAMLIAVRSLADQARRAL